MDGGVHGDTCIILSSGERICISDVKVGYKLKSGDVVIGCVKISGENIKLYHHVIGNDIIVGTKNIQLLSNSKTIEISSECSVLYNILTDTKRCTLNNIKCGDYNTSIDIFLY